MWLRDLRLPCLFPKVPQHVYFGVESCMHPLHRRYLWVVTTFRLLDSFSQRDVGAVIRHFLSSENCPQQHVVRFDLFFGYLRFTAFLSVTTLAVGVDDRLYFESKFRFH